VTAVDLALARARATRDALQHHTGESIRYRLRADVRGAPRPNDEGEWTGEERDGYPRVTLKLGQPELMGEHGFRFFPRFYEHLFHTLRRIPLTDEDGHPTHRTVFDRLVPVERLGIVLEDDRDPHLLLRRRPQSLDELRSALQIWQAWGIPARDAVAYALRLLRFLTSGPSRRVTYEQMTWWDFLGASELSAPMQSLVLGASQNLIALNSRAAEARTAGAIEAQLMMDQVGRGDGVDRALDGPTTEAWLEPWRAHLEALGVRFLRGECAGLTWADHRVQLQFTDAGLLDPRAGITLSADDLLATPPDYVVLAVDVRTARKLTATLPPGLDTGPLNSWPLNDPPVDQAPTREQSLQHMTGLQFFSQHLVRLFDGNAYFPDAPWGLSGVGQLDFWTRRRRPEHGILSVISVDICDWAAPGGAGVNGRSAWQCSADEIATEVWTQLGAALPVQLPCPALYHLDEHMYFEREGPDGSMLPSVNQMPFLVNVVGQWQHRPGAHAVQGGLVLAGAYMKTSTRLTTMEAANESARRAVNAILDAVEAERGTRHQVAARCELWPMEDREPADLAPLRALDEALFNEGLPHAADILEIDALAVQVEELMSGASGPEPLLSLLTGDVTTALSAWLQEALGA